MLKDRQIQDVVKGNVCRSFRSGCNPASSPIPHFQANYIMGAAAETFVISPNQECISPPFLAPLFSPPSSTTCPLPSHSLPSLHCHCHCLQMMSGEGSSRAVFALLQPGSSGDRSSCSSWVLLPKLCKPKVGNFCCLFGWRCTCSFQ